MNGLLLSKRNDKRGSLFFGLAIGLFIFVIGVLIIPFFTDTITQARTDLNCTSAATITNGVKIVCLFHDLMIPYLIWFFVSLALGIIAGAGK